jgi:transcriptional regulator with XRE-family HTH domain
MAIREGPRQRARAAALAARPRLGAELRTARRNSGLSQDEVAGRCHLSDSQVLRIERGTVAGPSLEAVACIAAVVGLDLVIRTYPGGDAIRDAGHWRLLERLRRQLHEDLVFRTEVPLPIAGDLRAWDAIIAGKGWQLPVEAETVLDDGQALERKLALKLRDGGFGHLILLVADTTRNRARIPAIVAGGKLPLDGRSILRALREGRDPGASGLLIL